MFKWTALHTSCQKCLTAFAVGENVVWSNPAPDAASGGDLYPYHVDCAPSYSTLNRWSEINRFCTCDPRICVGHEFSLCRYRQMEAAGWRPPVRSRTSVSYDKAHGIPVPPPPEGRKVK